MRPWRGVARRRDERGVAAVLVAVLVSLVLLVSAAFAVDLGQQRVVRRDMQAIADVVALDLARHLHEGPASSYDKAAIDDAKNASVARNDEALGGKLDAADVTWEFVRWDGGKWSVVAKDSGLVPEAIRVSASSDTAFAFGGITGIERGGATRRAVASQSEPSVCVSVGTKTLTLDTSGSVLGPLLEDGLGLLDVDVDVIGYDGIVNLKNVYVPLADLLVELDIGTTSELAGANVSLADLTLAMADVARRGGDTAGANILEAISLGVEDVNIALGQLIDVSGSDDLAGLGAGVNALDLLGASVFAATGEHALEAEIPSILKVEAIEAPQMACGKGDGKTTAKSAQVTLTLDALNILGALSEAGITAPASILNGSVKLQVQVGAGTARIDEIDCAGGRVRLQVDTGAAAVMTVPDHITIGIRPTAFLSALGPLLDGVVGGLLRLALAPLIGSEVGIRATAEAVVASSSRNRWIVFPPAPARPGTIVFPEPDSVRKTLHLNGANVEIISGGIVGVLGDVLNPALAGLLSGVVTPLLNDALTPLLDGLVAPLLRALGIGLGVAEVSVGDRPVCNSIKLVG